MSSDSDLAAAETLASFINSLDVLNTNYTTESQNYVTAVRASQAKEAITQAESLADTCTSVANLKSGDRGVDAAFRAYGVKCAAGWTHLAAAIRLGKAQLVTKAQKELAAAQALFETARVRLSKLELASGRSSASPS